MRIVPVLEGEHFGNGERKYNAFVVGGGFVVHLRSMGSRVWFRALFGCVETATRTDETHVGFVLLCYSKLVDVDIQIKH